MNESCSYFEKQKEITTGLLPTASSACITQNEISTNLSSYTFKRYSTDGIVDNWPKFHFELYALMKQWVINL